MSAKLEYENNSDQVYGNGKADNATQSLFIKPKVGEWQQQPYVSQRQNSLMPCLCIKQTEDRTNPNASMTYSLQ